MHMVLCALHFAGYAGLLAKTVLEHLPHVLDVLAHGALAVCALYVLVLAAWRRNSKGKAEPLNDEADF